MASLFAVLVKRRYESITAMQSAKEKRKKSARSGLRKPPESTPETVVWYWEQDNHSYTVMYSVDTKEIWCNGASLQYQDKEKGYGDGPILFTITTTVESPCYHEQEAATTCEDSSLRVTTTLSLRDNISRSPTPTPVDSGGREVANSTAGVDSQTKENQSVTQKEMVENQPVDSGNTSLSTPILNNVEHNGSHEISLGISNDIEPSAESFKEVDTQNTNGMSFTCTNTLMQPPVHIEIDRCINEPAQNVSTAYISETHHSGIPNQEPSAQEGSTCTCSTDSKVQSIYAALHEVIVDEHSVVYELYIDGAMIQEHSSAPLNYARSKPNQYKKDD